MLFRRQQIKIFIILAVLRQNVKRVAGLISATYRRVNTAPKKRRSGCEFVGNTMFDLTYTVIEPQTYRTDRDVFSHCASL